MHVKKFLRICSLVFFCNTLLVPLLQAFDTAGTGAPQPVVKLPDIDFGQAYSSLQRMNKEHNIYNTLYGAGKLTLLGLTCWGAYECVKYMKKVRENVPQTMGNRPDHFAPVFSFKTFDDVAGATEAKEELSDVVEFLKDPVYFKRLGAKLPRGILLVGNPGNGKTLLAKAIAGEARCPFFSVGGAEFVEVFVGVGALRVRNLFAQAHRHAPCIIFIDELDAIGSKRLNDSGSQETNQTLNQLLTEMDGFFTSDQPILVIGATNRPEVLDPALLRPGRFDKKVEVPFPNLQDRRKILAVHLEGITIDPNVNLDVLARATTGFSGAELANLVNEAALLASKNPYQSMVMQGNFNEARDIIIMGKAMHSKIMSQEERNITAYHEAGHALVRILVGDADPLYKVTIIPRGFSLGSTHSIPERDSYTQSREQMMAIIKTCLGGRAAELLLFKKFMTGAHNDLEHATRIARRMVCHYGMSEEVGPLVFDEGTRYSEATLRHIDETVKAIITTAHKEVMMLLADNKAKLEKIAQALLVQETLDAAQVYELAGLRCPAAVAG